MNPLLHLYHQSLIPAHRLPASAPTWAAQIDRRPNRLSTALRAAWGSLRDMSRRATIEWVERMEAQTVREALR
jgi:hypothetical protein